MKPGCKRPGYFKRTDMKKIKIIPKVPQLTIKPDAKGDYYVNEDVGTRLINFGLAKRAGKKTK